jgi:hypothetical protein
MRKIGIAFVVLAVIWAIPGARTQVVATAHPTLERLGPRAEFVIRPARREAAKKQMKAILRVAVADQGSGIGVPVGNGFQEWMRLRIPELSGLDPWGGAYWMTSGAETLTVHSSGPDGVRGTEDDLHQTVTF